MQVEHLYTSRLMSRVFRGLILSIALILVACGGDTDEPDPTATADTGLAAVPTAPGGPGTPDTHVSEDEITVIAPEQPSSDEATPSGATDEASPEAEEGVQPDDPDAGPVDLTGLMDTESTPADVDEESSLQSDSDAIETAAPSTPESNDGAVLADATADVDDNDDAEPTVRARTGNETFDHPGDGTGGSGMPGEPNAVGDPVEAGEAATPVASPSAAPVAQLSISGCEVPDVPGFLGDNSSFLLLADVNFRTGPGVDCDLVFDEPLGEGQIVEVVGGPVTQQDDDSEWVQIEVNGQTGWITTEFIESAE